MKLNKIWAVAAALTIMTTASTAVLAQGGGGRGGRIGFGGPGMGGPLQLLQDPLVVKELKIEDAQTDLLKQLGAEFQTKRRELFQGARENGGFQAIQPKMEALSAEENKKVAEILDAKQMARLKQLQVQRAGANALLQTEVQTSLKITPDQKTKLMAVQMEQGEAMRQMFSGFQGGQRPSEEQMAEFRKKMEDMRTQGEGKMLAVLTPDQKKQFEGLKGAPFTFSPFGGPRRQQQ